jgi:hypothetical protein
MLGGTLEGRQSLVEGSLGSHRRREIQAGWDILVAGRVLPRVRLVSGGPVCRERRVRSAVGFTFVFSA